MTFNHGVEGSSPSALTKKPLSCRHFSLPTENSRPIKAINLVDEGRFGHIASLRNNRITEALLEEAGKTNYLDCKKAYDPKNFVPRLIADTMYFNTT